MSSSENKKSFRKKRELDIKTVLWIILLILLALFLFYAFFKEMKQEEEYQKHKDVEHNNSL